jgi:cysteine desulfurase/selenocysteine lyase
MPFDVKKLRMDFPSLQKIHNNKPIVYFDNACMTLKPSQVTDAIIDYYQNFPGCHGRTNHLFGAETTKKIDESRRKIQRFYNASSMEEIIFVRNSTEGLNLLANTIDFKPGDIIVSSDIEHNSNLRPWQVIERKKDISRIMIPTNEDTTFNVEKFKEKMSSKVRLVTVLATSNLTGVSFPLEEIIQHAHGHGALVCVDAAQSSLYQPLDVQKMDIDFMVTSIHKMWGPTGVGILYGKKKFLNQLPQFLTGGETVEDTTYTGATIAQLPDKFEAGLQNYAGIIGAGATIDYIRDIGPKNIYAHILELNSYATSQISEMNGLRFLGPENPKHRSGITNLLIDGISAGDVSRILNESENIMTRFGKHCVHSWFNSRKLPESLRISFSAYNTFEEIDIMTKSLKSILKFFRH